MSTFAPRDRLDLARRKLPDRVVAGAALERCEPRRGQADERGGSGRARGLGDRLGTRPCGFVDPRQAARVSLTWAGCVKRNQPNGEEAHLHVAERDRVAVAQGGLADPLAVDLARR